jgi:hypothetical protein
MNEVKEICAAMLDAPEPPIRAGEEVYFAARRATRQRTARRLVGGGAGLAGLVAVALVAAGALTGPRATPQPDAVAGPSRLAPANRTPNMLAAAQTVLPDLPAAGQVTAHGDQMYRILFAAVPAGYHAERRYPGGNAPSLWFLPNGSASIDTAAYVATADVTIQADGREGGLAASVWGDRQPAPTGDLCSADVNTRMDRILGAADSCQVIIIGGLPMRVTTHHDPEQVEVINATWFVRNGFVTTSYRQGLPKYQPDTQLPPDAKKPGGRVPQYLPPLAHPLFTADQVAHIAANPDLLP